MKQRNLKLKNPERLNSSNHCLSGMIVWVKFDKEYQNHYSYVIGSTIGETFNFDINKSINDDNSISMKLKGNKFHLNIVKDIEFVKNRNTFLDYLVKRVEEELDNINTGLSF